MAIDERTEKVVGLVIGAIITKKWLTWNYWKVFPTKSETIQYLKNFEYNLIDSCEEILKKFQNSYHIFLVHRAKAFKNQFMKEQLLHQTFRMTNFLKIDVITFIAYRKNEVQRARRVGMEKIYTQIYQEYRKKHDHEVLRNIEGEHCGFVFILAGENLKSVRDQPIN